MAKKQQNWALLVVGLMTYGACTSNLLGFPLLRLRPQECDQYAAIVLVLSSDWFGNALEPYNPPLLNA